MTKAVDINPSPGPSTTAATRRPAKGSGQPGDFAQRFLELLFAEGNDGRPLSTETRSIQGKPAGDKTSLSKTPKEGFAQDENGREAGKSSKRATEPADAILAAIFGGDALSLQRSAELSVSPGKKALGLRGVEAKAKGADLRSQVRNQFKPGVPAGAEARKGDARAATASTKGGRVPGMGTPTEDSPSEGVTEAKSETGIAKGSLKNLAETAAGRLGRSFRQASAAVDLKLVNPVGQSVAKQSGEEGTVVRPASARWGDGTNAKGHSAKVDVQNENVAGCPPSSGAAVGKTKAVSTSVRLGTSPTVVSKAEVLPSGSTQVRYGSAEGAATPAKGNALQGKNSGESETVSFQRLSGGVNAGWAKKSTDGQAERAVDKAALPDTELSSAGRPAAKPTDPDAETHDGDRRAAGSAHGASRSGRTTATQVGREPAATTIFGGESGKSAAASESEPAVDARGTSASPPRWRPIGASSSESAPPSDSTPAGGNSSSHSDPVRSGGERGWEDGLVESSGKPTEHGTASSSPAVASRVATASGETGNLQTNLGHQPSTSPETLQGSARASAPLSPGNPPASESLAQQIFGQLVARMKLEKWPGVDSLSVQLRPEILGRVVIETRREDGDRLHTLIRAEDPAVKQLLELRLPELVQRLAEAGIRLDSATVEWSGSEAGGSQHHHQGGKPSPAGRTKTIDTPEPSPLEDVEGVTGAEGLSYFA